MDSNAAREASHAGSWYVSDKNKLNDQLTNWLKDAKTDIETTPVVKAIIGPHAGYSYSGPTAAWAYKYLSRTPETALRVFLLGPSHHAYIEGCGLSRLTSYETPIGDIELDTETIKELKESGNWQFTSKDVEEQEHSLEMHLPYIRKIFEGRKIKLVPIMVGAVDNEQEAYYGKLLTKYFDDENTVFCISSDFCHWGKRFRFTHYKEEDGEIYQSIEVLDRKGMSLIEEHNTKEFAKYLQTTKNTICGRKPIAILLNIINNSKNASKLTTKFVRYAQSGKVTDDSDSSVSYASAVTYIST